MGCRGSGGGCGTVVVVREMGVMMAWVLFVEWTVSVMVGENLN